MSDPDNQMYDPRRAGRVTRYHTWPRIKEQSVAEHQWNVARICKAIWPEMPLHVLEHCLFHDLGEVVAGDPPYPSKKMNPEFGREHAKIESSAWLRMAIPWGIPAQKNLSVEEHAIFKLSEFLEFWEWACEEQQMGNRFAALVERRCDEAISKFLDDKNPVIPEGVRNRATSYIVLRKKTYDADWPPNGIL